MVDKISNDSTILYDEYIDRRKMTEQKKTVQYIIPSPHTKLGQNKQKRYDENDNNCIIRSKNISINMGFQKKYGLRNHEKSSGFNSK